MYFKCTCDDLIYIYISCGMITKVIDTVITSHRYLFFFPLVRMLKIFQPLSGTLYRIHFYFHFPDFGPGQRSVHKTI